MVKCFACADGSLFELRYSGGLTAPRWELVYPLPGEAEPPNEDLSSDVREIYAEAAEISGRSPRGAAALLRLALQHLLIEAGLPGKKIDDDIQSLIDEGRLSPSIARAMDVVRITGNESVHPGEIVLDDDPDLVQSLFSLINVIANELITRPRVIDELFERMPQSKKDGVEQRQRRAQSNG